jgi:hypothetical protein
MDPPWSAIISSRPKARSIDCTLPARDLGGVSAAVAASATLDLRGMGDLAFSWCSG